MNKPPVIISAPNTSQLRKEIAHARDTIKQCGDLSIRIDAELKWLNNALATYGPKEQRKGIDAKKAEDLEAKIRTINEQGQGLPARLKAAQALLAQKTAELAGIDPISHVHTLIELVKTAKEEIRNLTALSEEKTEALRKLEETGNLSDSKVMAEIGQLNDLARLLPTRIEAANNKLVSLMEQLGSFVATEVYIKWRHARGAVETKLREKIRAALAPHFVEFDVAQLIDKTKTLSDFGIFVGDFRHYGHPDDKVIYAQQALHCFEQLATYLEQNPDLKA